MILLVHMLFGAAVGLSINNIYIAIIVAFLSHYFLDLFPHIEYNIKSTRRNAIIKILTDIIYIINKRNDPFYIFY